MIRKSTMLKLTGVVVALARLCAADPRIGAWKLVSPNSGTGSPESALDCPSGKERIKQSLVFWGRLKGRIAPARSLIFLVGGKQ